MKALSILIIMLIKNYHFAFNGNVNTTETSIKVMYILCQKFKLFVMKISIAAIGIQRAESGEKNVVQFVFWDTTV